MSLKSENIHGERNLSSSLPYYYILRISKYWYASRSNCTVQKCGIGTSQDIASKLSQLKGGNEVVELLAWRYQDVTFRLRLGSWRSALRSLIWGIRTVLMAAWVFARQASAAREILSGPHLRTHSPSSASTTLCSSWPRDASHTGGVHRLRPEGYTGHIQEGTKCKRDI